VINKTIIVGLVAIAFVVGSIMTGTMVDAAGDGKGNSIVDALNNIATAIKGINPTVNVSPTPINVSPTPINVSPTPINVSPTPINVSPTDPACPTNDFKILQVYNWRTESSWYHPILPSTFGGTIIIQLPMDKTFIPADLVIDRLNQLGYTNSLNQYVPVTISVSGSPVFVCVKP